MDIDGSKRVFDRLGPTPTSNDSGMDINGSKRVFDRLGPPTSSSNDNNGTKIQKVCYHWRAGNCTRRPCKFLHSELPPLVPVNGGGGLRRKRKMCKYWLEGKCSLGDKCRFLHARSTDPCFKLLTNLEGHQNVVTGIALPTCSNRRYTWSKDESVSGCRDCQSGQHNTDADREVEVEVGELNTSKISDDIDNPVDDQTFEKISKSSEGGTQITHKPLFDSGVLNGAALSGASPEPYVPSTEKAQEMQIEVEVVAGQTSGSASILVGSSAPPTNEVLSSHVQTCEKISKSSEGGTQITHKGLFDSGVLTGAALSGASPESYVPSTEKSQGMQIEVEGGAEQASDSASIPVECSAPTIDKVLSCVADDQTCEKICKSSEGGTQITHKALFDSGVLTGAAALSAASPEPCVPLTEKVQEMQIEVEGGAGQTSDFASIPVGSSAPTTDEVLSSPAVNVAQLLMDSSVLIGDSPNVTLEFDATTTHKEMQIEVISGQTVLQDAVSEPNVSIVCRRAVPSPPRQDKKRKRLPTGVIHQPHNVQLQSYGLRPTVKNMCNNWFQGKCTLGDNCRFLHAWFTGDWFKKLTKPEGHQNVVTGIALPSGSDKLYTESTNESVRVWDCQSGQHNTDGEVGKLNTSKIADNVDDPVDDQTFEEILKLSEGGTHIDQEPLFGSDVLTGAAGPELYVPLTKKAQETSSFLALAQKGGHGKKVNGGAGQTSGSASIPVWSSIPTTEEVLSSPAVNVHKNDTKKDMQSEKKKDTPSSEPKVKDHSTPKDWKVDGKEAESEQKVEATNDVVVQPDKKESVQTTPGSVKRKKKVIRKVLRPKVVKKKDTVEAVALPDEKSGIEKDADKEKTVESDEMGVCLLTEKAQETLSFLVLAQKGGNDKKGKGGAGLTSGSASIPVWRTGKNCTGHQCNYLHPELPGAYGGVGGGGFHLWSLQNFSNYRWGPQPNHYHHQQHQSYVSRPAVKKLCDYWIQGKCTFGDNCRYLHEGHQNVVTGIALPSGESVSGSDCQSGQHNTDREVGELDTCKITDDIDNPVDDQTFEKISKLSEGGTQITSNKALLDSGVLTVAAALSGAGQTSGSNSIPVGSSAPTTDEVHSSLAVNAAQLLTDSSVLIGDSPNVPLDVDATTAHKEKKIKVISSQTVLQDALSEPNGSIVGMKAVPTQHKKRKRCPAGAEFCVLSGEETFGEFVDKFAEVGKQAWNCLQKAKKEISDLKAQNQMLCASEYDKLKSLTQLQTDHVKLHADMKKVEQQNQKLQFDNDQLMKDNQKFQNEVNRLEAEMKIKDAEFAQHYTQCLKVTAKSNDVPSKVSTISEVNGHPSLSCVKPRATEASTLGDGANEQGRSICIRNLALDTNFGRLAKGLMKFGPIKRVGIHIECNNTSKSCFADVEFENAFSTKKAVKAPPIKFGSRGFLAVIEEKIDGTQNESNGLEAVMKIKDDEFAQHYTQCLKVDAKSNDVPSKVVTISEVDGQPSLTYVKPCPTEASTLGDGAGEQGRSICVRNLALDANFGQLAKGLKKFGPIKRVVIHIECNNMLQSKCCFADVELESAVSARNAIKASPIRIGGNIGGSLAVIEEKRGTGGTEDQVNRLEAEMKIKDDEFAQQYTPVSEGEANP